MMEDDNYLQRCICILGPEHSKSPWSVGHPLASLYSILYGTADIEVMTPDASKEIIAIINRYHPGTGTFRELVHTNHSFAKVGPMEVEYIHQQEGLRVNDMKEKFNEDGFRYFVEWAGK